MLELMRKPHTEELTDICLRVPSGDALRISKVIADVLNRAGEHVGEVNAEGDELFTLEEVFPDSTPGALLKGARYKEGMSQEQLSQASGIARRHISEMENNRRSIGKERARRLAEVLKVDYRVFL
ncbi:MAG: helix-turn-helix domain-containing protein [Desulfomicrobium sp.]